jgi:hypothetical protein
MTERAAASDFETRQRVEQRREPRMPASGAVDILLGEGGEKSALKRIHARLLDRSASGFRAEHDCAELSGGQLVRFRLRAAPMAQARVVWTRIEGRRIESGFRILPL